MAYRVKVHDRVALKDGTQGKVIMVKPTLGNSVLVEWDDGITTWANPAYLKVVL